MTEKPAKHMEKQFIEGKQIIMWRYKFISYQRSAIYSNGEVPNRMLVY